MQKEKNKCNDDCLNCPLPMCKYDQGKTEVISISDYKDRKDYIRQYRREYYQKNKERIKEHQRKYRRTHREKVNEIRRKSYYRNKERELERQKAYNLRRALSE